MPLKYVRHINVGSPVKYPTRVFASVLPAIMSEGMGFMGIIREFDTRDSGGKTILRMLTWNDRWRLIDDIEMGVGEDPRFFALPAGCSAITYVTPVGYPNWTDFDVHVRTYSKDVVLKFSPNLGEYYGKNWVPVVIDSELMMIRSLNPLCVCRVDLDASTATPIVGTPTKEIGQYRGGGRALFLEKKIVGFGHRTLNGQNHIPFRYEIDPTTWKIVVEELDNPDQLHRCGIIDPTSYWRDEAGRDFVTACATPGNWNDYQLVEHVLLEYVPEGQ